MSDRAIRVAMGSALLLCVWPLKLLLRWEWLFGWRWGCVVCRVWAVVGGDELGLLLAGCCEGDQRRRRSIEMEGALLVFVKAEWVDPYLIR